MFETAHGHWICRFFEADKTSGERERVLEKVGVLETLGRRKTWRFSMAIFGVLDD